MKKSKIFWNSFLFGLCFYFILNQINNWGTKPIGSISYSQYIQNVENGNINKIIATNYNNNLIVNTIEPIKTLEYERALTINKKFEENDNLTIFEKLKKRLHLYPSEKTLKTLEKSYYEKSYHVLAPENVKNLFEKIDLKNSNIYVEVKTRTLIQYIIAYLLSLLPTALFFILILSVLSKYQESSGILGEAMRFTKNEKKTNVKLSDVVGIEEDLKLEITEIIDFIKNPEKFKKMNAKSPKGILMIGEPGVGKTMLAKAIANEAEVDFYYKNASDLNNPYVGMATKTVKNLFKEARKSKNAIIFLDEIDSIGSREVKFNSMNDVGIINALLAEMDGFEENHNVIVIGATNHPDKLDKALLREGRFDRKITIPLPNLKGREEILASYLKNKKTSEDVDIKTFAKLTIGCSGATLSGLINEASIIAVRENSDIMTMEHLMKARDKKIMGVPYKNFSQSEKQKRITAYHEAGHAVLMHLLDPNNKLYKVSILPRTGSLGVTVSVPLEENKNYNKTELENRIKILFGGRIAEEIYFNEISTGASNDIERANNITEKMTKEWGMSNLGLRHIENTHERKYSEKLLEEVDLEKETILKRNYLKAKEILNKNKKYLEMIAERLLEKEEIDEKELEEIFSLTNKERKIIS